MLRLIKHATGLSQVIVHGVSALVYAVTDRQNVLYTRDSATYVDVLDPVRSDETRFLLQETVEDVTPKVFQFTLNAQRIHVRVFPNSQPTAFVHKDKFKGFLIANPQNACVLTLMCAHAERNPFYEHAYAQYANYIHRHPDSEYALYGLDPLPLY